MTIPEMAAALRKLNDGVSRPVTIIEREICGIVADFFIIFNRVPIKIVVAPENKAP